MNRINRHKLLLASALIWGISLTAHAQPVVVQEGELGIDFIKWHYNYYPGNQISKWEKQEVEGQTIYSAYFVHNNQNFLVTYTPEGYRIKEKIDLSNEEITPEIASHLRGSFDKYKVISYFRVNDFTSKYEFNTTYLVEIKSNNGQETLWYDEYYTYLDPNQLASTK